MRPTHVLKTSLASGTYVLDGTIAGDVGGPPQLIVSTSERICKQYDTRRFSHVRDITGHTDRITDVMGQGNVLVTSQEDTGVMITDLRMAQPAHFLTELRGEGLVCNTVSISPSFQNIAVAAGGNVHIVDPRTWSGVRVVNEVHCGDVTKMRHVTDTLIASGGEDNMINFFDTEAQEADMLRCTVSCGESLNRITVMADLGLVGVSGSCEGAYLFKVPANPVVEDFPTEHTIKRGEDFARYMVDWVSIRGQAYLITGHNSAFDMDDATAESLGPAPQPLTVRVEPPNHSADPASSSFQLTPVHSDVVRMALVVGSSDRLVTAGEDGTIAVWNTSTSGAESGDASPERSFGSENDFGNAAGGQSDSSGQGRFGGGGRERPEKKSTRGPLNF
jgi:WD40 repeat protein